MSFIYQSYFSQAKCEVCWHIQNIIRKSLKITMLINNNHYDNNNYNKYTSGMIKGIYLVAYKRADKLYIYIYIYINTLLRNKEVSNVAMKSWDIVDCRHSLSQNSILFIQRRILFLCRTHNSIKVTLDITVCPVQLQNTLTHQVHYSSLLVHSKYTAADRVWSLHLDINSWRTWFY